MNLHPARPFVRRSAALLVALTLSAGACGSEGSDDGDAVGGDPTASEAAAQDTPRALAAADWLTAQLEDGLLLGQYGADYGLSIDTALSLEGIEPHEETVASITQAVAANVESYTTGVDFDSQDVYAGPVAKAAVLAQVAGEDPADFGGVDLVDRLEDRVADQAPAEGRLGDDVTDPKGTDYANTIGQAYAVRALTAAGSAEASAATAYLLDQQCEAGYFRLYFGAPDATDQGCDAASRKDSPPDTDVTAMAVLALAELPEDAEVDPAVDRAVAWLLAEQGADGGFGGGISTPSPNANSTGLAGWALGGQGEQEAAARAAGWLSDLQVSDLPCEGKQDETGAVAYDDAALADGRGGGLDDARDQWRSATVQAVPALRWTEDVDELPAADCAGD